MSNSIEPRPLLGSAGNVSNEPSLVETGLSRDEVRDHKATASVVGVVAATAIATTIAFALSPTGLSPFMVLGIVVATSSHAGWFTGKLIKHCNLQDAQFRNSFPCLRKVTCSCFYVGQIALFGIAGLIFIQSTAAAIAGTLSDAANVISSIEIAASVIALFCIKMLNSAELESFPEYVEGNLNLSGCTFSLPDNFTVSGDLNLRDCTSLSSLPDHLTVHGDLDLGGCTSLSSLPNWIATLGTTSAGRTRIVNLASAGLSQDIIDRLRRQPAEGMQFHFDIRTNWNASDNFATIEEGIGFWKNLTVSNGPLEEQSIQIPEECQSTFLEFISRLKETAEYKNIQTQKTLASRIITVLSKMHENAEFKQEALDYMYTAITSCNDRIIKGLDEIELKALVVQAEKEGNRETLRELGKGLMHLDALHETIRKEVIPNLTWVDEIEVILAFEIQLREKLSLPTQTQTMLFRACAGVTDERIEAVGDQILTSCEGNLDDYLSTWGPWEKYLRWQEVKDVIYEALQKGESLGGANCECAITKEPSEKPVYIQGTNEVFEFEALQRHYVEKGTNPLTNKKFDWKNVRRCSFSKRLRIN